MILEFQGCSSGCSTAGAWGGMEEQLLWDLCFPNSHKTGFIICTNLQILPLEFQECSSGCSTSKIQEKGQEPQPWGLCFPNSHKTGFNLCFNLQIPPGWAFPGFWLILGRQNEEDSASPPSCSLYFCIYLNGLWLHVTEKNPWQTSFPQDCSFIAPGL